MDWHVNCESIKSYAVLCYYQPHWHRYIRGKNGHKNANPMLMLKMLISFYFIRIVYFIWNVLRTLSGEQRIDLQQCFSAHFLGNLRQSTFSAPSQLPVHVNQIIRITWLLWYRCLGRLGGIENVDSLEVLKDSVQEDWFIALMVNIQLSV